jgi:arylsulfatase A-like enzyme
MRVTPQVASSMTVRCVKGLTVGSVLLASLLGFRRSEGDSVRRTQRPRSLLLVTVDALRFDAGIQGTRYADIAIPPSLHSRGHHYLNAIAASTWTGASFMAIMTGRYPSESGVIGFWPTGVMPVATPLAERLRSAGFATAAVVSNPV